MTASQIIQDIEKRRNIHLNNEKFPHPIKKIRYLDRFVFFISFLIPLAALPQIYDIWVNKTIGGVSTLTWTIYLLFTLPMVAYGYFHKYKPIIIMYCLSFVVDLVIVLGVLFIK